MTKHTPGPWTAEDSAHRNEWSHWISGGDVRTIAAVSTHDNCNDNARLIAASPELLKAVEHVLNASEANGGINWQKLRDAVAKATK